jgi:hypothetical protein
VAREGSDDTLPGVNAPDELGRLAPEDLRTLTSDPLLLERRDDLPSFVPTLPPTSFVAVARGLHGEDRLELLLPHASPEQLTALFDLEAWRRDRVDIDRARVWLTAIVDAYAQTKARGELGELMMDMDPELWTFALLPGTSVFHLDPDDDEQRNQARDAVEALYTYETPDGFFLVAVPDTETGHRAIHVLDRVYADDLELGRTLVNSLRGALASQIEEDLLRWRAGRLADLGFVPWEEAMKLLRPLDLKAAREVASAIPSPAAPVLPAETARAGLLRRALAALTPAQQGERAREFTLLVNELMAAQRFEPGDAKLQERSFHQAESTIGLGLELLAAGIGDDGEQIHFLAGRIAAIGLRGVFRVGYGPLDKLRRAALALHREGHVSLKSIGSLLDRPWGHALEALARWYPELPIESTSAGTRAIAGLRDLARATELIAQAGALAALSFRGYAIDPVWVTRADEPERLSLGDLVRTAIVHLQLPGRRGDFAPLSADDIAWARDHLRAGDGHLLPALAHDLRARCLAVGAPQHAEVFITALLGRLEVELGSLEQDSAGMPDLVRVGSLLTIQRVSVWLKTGLQAT